MKPNQSKILHRRKVLGLCMGGAMALGAGLTICDSVQAEDAHRLGNLEKENSDLKARLEVLELMAKKEGILPSGAAEKKMVSALSDITVSGFATASYFYDSSSPKDNTSNGYLWNTSHNDFSVNKVKLTLASAPVERSGDEWDAAFRISMIWGEDAPIVNTTAGAAGYEDLREAFIELNVPIGTGLNVRAGQLISLLNYESGDGGAANNNFSQGYQWFYTGNGPSAGVQLGYVFTDHIDVKVRVQNGMYAGAFDGNDQKTVMGAIGIKPWEKTWFSLIGFGGRENANMTVAGGSVLAGHQLTEQASLGFEFDYFDFNFDNAPDGQLWSVGGWLSYDFSAKVGLGLRAEFLEDSDGVGIPGVGVPGRLPGLASPDPDGNLASVALTLNYKPTPNVKIQPEIRYDRTGYKDGFDGKEGRVIFGAGVSYLF